MKYLLEKKLIVIRHAHRSKSLGNDADNGISDRGKSQVKELTRFFKRRFKKSPLTLYSSPKIRCQQTILPIAKLTKSRIQTLDCLDESRTDLELRGRLREFERVLSGTDAELIAICSHGDWIPAFLETSTGIRLELEKSGWAELDLHGNQGNTGDSAGWRELRWLIQEFE